MDEFHLRRVRRCKGMGEGGGSYLWYGMGPTLAIKQETQPKLLSSREGGML